MTEVTAQTVVYQIAEAQQLLTSLTTQVVANRINSAAANQSEQLSNKEMAQRLAKAIAALRGEAPTSQEKIVLAQEEARALITEAGGIFIGKEELLKLGNGKLAPDAVIPEIPARYSQAFLESSHPLRDGTIASHIILSFDPESNKWHTIDRGNGGKSDIVPGSLGEDGRGLSGEAQDQLLRKDGAQIKVEGVEISTHNDSFPIERIIINAIALHLAAGRPIEQAPLRGIYGRTGDTERGASGCRVLLGFSYAHGVNVHAYYHSDYAHNDVGLLAGWN